MTIEVISDVDAVANIKQNVVGGWPNRNSGDNRVEPLAKPALFPRFVLQQGETILTIGSCFARNVEDELQKRGFELPSRAILNVDDEMLSIGSGVLNNYGVPSIYNELAWALGEKTFNPEQNFFEISEGKFIDIHLSEYIKPASLEVLTNRRAAIAKAYGSVTTCGLVVITLGLSECWYDREAENYLNTAPRRQIMRRFPGRFELRVLDYAEITSILSKALDLIKAKGRADIRVIMSVSPVPLTRTYRSCDVIAANTYSKAVLRAAAEEMVAKYDFIDYLPSYESILHSDRKQAWEDDLIHVKRGIVDLNVSRMVQAYTKSSEFSGSEDLLPHLKALSEAGRYKEVLADVGDVSRLANNPELAILYCEAALEEKMKSEARQALDLIPADPSDDRREWAECKTLFLEQRYVDLAARLSSKRNKFGDYKNFWRMLIISYGERKIAKRVMWTAEEWLKRNPHMPEPLRLAAKYLAECGLHEEAEKCLVRAIALPRDTTLASLEYAAFLVERGRAQEAGNILDFVVPMGPAQEKALSDIKAKVRLASPVAG